MTPTRPIGARSRVSLMAGAAAIGLLIPTLSLNAASAASAPDVEPTKITSAGAFTQTVPDGVCAATVTIAGAAGGLAIADGDAEPDPEAPGELRGANGAGGVITASLNVTAGAVLTGSVGRNGGNGGAGGLPGGGEGGTGSHPGGGGGGYSELIFQGERLLLAGGGGGTGGGHTAEFGNGGDAAFDHASGIKISGGTVFPGSDGADGQDRGINTPPADGPTTAPGGGKGGSAAGGAAGVNPRSQVDSSQPGFNWDAQPGSSLQGGNGGADNFADTGAGGGGGFFGGGGGAATDGDVSEAGKYFVGGGGGGGSSYVADSALIDAGSVGLAKNRNADGAALPGYVSFDWVMCKYDLAVTKTVVGNPVYEDGGTVRYSVVVTNAGPDTMAIGDTVTLADDLATGGTLVAVKGLDTSVPAVGEKIPAAGIEAYNLVDVPGADPDAPATQGKRGLAAGESVEFVYDVVVAGTEPVTNTVVVTDRGEQSNNTAKATIAPAAPSLALVKTADVERATEVGQEITYSFAVTNTGNIEVRNIAIGEQAFNGKGTLPDPTCPVGPIKPGDSVTCSTVYTVVAADLTGAILVNTASATGATPMGKAVMSGDATAEVVTVKPAPAVPSTPAANGNLAATGGGENIGFYAGAAALLLLMGSILIMARRAARNS